MGLMFVGDKAAAASELHRVVAPSGRVAVNTPGHISPVLEAMRDAIADNVDPNLGVSSTPCSRCPIPTSS